MNEKKAEEFRLLHDLEENTIQLPRDIHYNKSTWFLYGVIRKLSIQGFTAYWMISSTIYLARPTIPGIMLFILGFISLLGLVFIEYPEKKEKRLEVTQRTRFLTNVIEAKPFTDMEKWDIIAYNMNKHLYLGGDWPRNDYFYDGENCRDTFKKLFIDPHSGKQSKNENTNAYTELEPYIEEAVKYFDHGIYGSQKA